MNIETLLHKEIEAEFDVLKDIDMDAKHYETAVNGVTKLLDKAIELEKLNIEQEKIEKENEIEKQRVEEDKKGRTLDRAVTVGTTLLTLGTMVGMTIYTFANEKEVPVTTIIGRGVIQKFTNFLKIK